MSRAEYFREWRRKNRDEYNARIRDRYANDPEYRAKRIAHHKKRLTEKAAEVEAAQVRGRVNRAARWLEIKQRLASARGAHGGRCGGCGWVPESDVHWPAVEFHHRSPSTKLFTLSSSAAYRDMDILMAEAEKCDVLCSRCHRIREAEADRARLLDAVKNLDRSAA